jgi:hypothetical protein
LAGDIGPDDIDERIRDRLDRLRLPNVGPAPAEARNSLEAVMNGRGERLFFDGPLERPEDATDPLVDLISAEAGGYHVLTNRLEPTRPELPGYRLAIESAEGPEGQPDIHRLRGRLAVLDVVSIDMFEVRQEHFVDGEILRPG